MVKSVLWFVIGLGIFIGLISLLFLIDGNIGGFFGTAVAAAGFLGLGWAGQKLLIPLKDNQNPVDAGKIALTIFGGAGICMILGSFLLFFDEEIEGAIGLFLFGSVFCLAGYIAFRIFRIPRGKKRILVSEKLQKFSGNCGQRGQRRSQHYRYVDKNLSDSEIEKMQNKWSEKPWTQRKDWAEGKVIQEGAHSLGFLIGFTILWNLISWGITAFAFIAEWETGDIPWFILIFPLVGILLFIITIRNWLREKKFGISSIKLDTLPAYLGDRLRGRIETGVSALEDPARTFHIKFLCARRTSSRDHDGKKMVTEKELWSEDQDVYSQLSESMKTLRVSLYFNVPPDLPPTELIPEDDRILWRIHVSCHVPGIDYAAQFEVPVYPVILNRST